MPAIGSFGPMGGMPAMNLRYQDLSAERRQTGRSGEEQLAAAREEPVQKDAAASAARPAPEAAPAPRPEARTDTLPTVESLDNAAQTLSQMRVQFSDIADSAFDRFRAESALNAQDGAQAQQNVAADETEEAESQGEAVPAVGTESKDVSGERTAQQPAPTVDRRAMDEAAPGEVPPPQEELPQTAKVPAQAIAASPAVAVTAGIL